ncbi:hypothetical protein CEXT_32141 [Caerostris extrusa]|uniref:Uncharacterized protein n=1 Tax=Caerostris extrusa TaxID=172846 RepID=A0AAV4QGJ1_CAEEX|nr:hypothetical protein CEXT_32141 [Caerostris extrusa]
MQNLKVCGVLGKDVVNTRVITCEMLENSQSENYRTHRTLGKNARNPWACEIFGKDVVNPRVYGSLEKDSVEL